MRFTDVTMKNNNKTKFFFHALIGGAVLLGIGCQTPPIIFSPADVGLSKVKIDAELKSVSVTIAQTKDRKTQNKIDIAQLSFHGISSIDIQQAWKMAIDDAIVRMVLFNDNSEKKVSIIVKIIEFDLAALSSKSTFAAQYQLIDRGNGDILFTSDIKTDGKSSTFTGNIRIIEQINNGVQRNILQFLQQLENTNIDKPIFPGRKEPDENP